MTPLEKVDELIGQFRTYEMENDNDFEYAVLNSITCVNNIIKTVQTLDDSHWQKDTLEFWSQVKQELEKYDLEFS
jgi:hypothetical protein